MRLLLAKKKSAANRGFTLIELLMVILILGVLAAVALPNFLNQSVKARQAEAKQVMRTVNHSQSMYRAQNAQFADNFDTLAAGIVKSSAGTPNTAQTESYTYTIALADADKATLIANPKDAAAKTYSGGIWRYLINGSNTAFAIDYCESDSNGVAAAQVSLVANQIQCPAQFHSISETK
jgi:type IV pilus assembly protein PilA